MKSNVERLESEWAPGGFFWALRDGNFDQAAFDRVRVVLKDLDFSDSDLLPKRLVSLLWFAPSYVEWQRARVKENGGPVADYECAVLAVNSEIQRILGVP